MGWMISDLSEYATLARGAGYVKGKNTNYWSFLSSLR
jgi:hypothetical protein